MIVEDFSQKLARLLRGISVPHDDCALAFSGGLDSGLIAYVLREKGFHLTLYTVGSEKSKDVLNAEESARLLNMTLKVLPLTEKDVVEAIGFLKKLDSDITPVEISFEIPLYIVCKYSKEKSIITGQGSDELFGGYLKYLKTPEKMKDDLEKLLTVTLPREKRIAAHFDKNLITPYLSKDFIDFARKVPDYLKIHNGVRKYILRVAAKHLDVPDEIAFREKKAAQYGSGAWKLMKKLAKKEKLSVEEFVNSI